MAFASAAMLNSASSLAAECCARDAVPTASPAPIGVPGPYAADEGTTIAEGYAGGGYGGGPGYWQPGGYEGRIGSPYYYSPLGNGRQYWYGAMAGTPAHAAYVPGGGGWDRPRGGLYSAGDGPGYATRHSTGYGPGSGYGMGGDPYTAHFGPGFQRHSNYGHDRFPYYTYRAPWYFPGPAVWNRDTNFAW
ncbi:MAG: hypothetical protein WD066_03415 [Planctomycetaceae bacterium]